MLEFCLGLKDYSIIKILDLSANRIGSNIECINALAEALKNNKTLKMLDISFNDIKVNCYEYLASNLAENHDLIELRLAGNQLRLDIDG